jgi:hypothetical protein
MRRHPANRQTSLETFGIVFGGGAVLACLGAQVYLVGWLLFLP